MKNQVIRSLVLQYITGGIYLLGTGLWDSAVLFSSGTGCLAALIPATYFSIRMLRARDKCTDAAQFLGYALRSELGKWIMTGLIFWLAFTSGYPWDPVFLFVGFILILITGGIAAIINRGYE